MNELIEKVIDWGTEKEILSKGKTRAQAKKMLEESGETLGAVYEGNLDSIRDGIGDTVVTLILLARMHDMSLRECLTAAYEEIKDRRGRIINGTFVKNR